MDRTAVLWCPFSGSPGDMQCALLTDFLPCSGPRSAPSTSLHAPTHRSPSVKAWVEQKAVLMGKPAPLQGLRSAWLPSSTTTLPSWYGGVRALEGFQASRSPCPSLAHVSPFLSLANDTGCHAQACLSKAPGWLPVTQFMG